MLTECSPQHIINHFPLFHFSMMSLHTTFNKLPVDILTLRQLPHSYSYTKTHLLQSDQCKIDAVKPFSN